MDSIDMTYKFGILQHILGLSGDELFSTATELGFDGVELTIFDSAESEWFGAAGRAKVRAHTADEGIAIPSAALLEFNQYGYTSGEPAVRQRTTDALLRSIDWAHEVGIPLLLIPFFGESEITNTQSLSRVVDGLRSVSNAADQAGVVLGVESSLDAATNLDLLTRVESPSVRLYYDVCNAAFWGHPAETDLKPLGDVVVQIHLKDGNTGPWDAYLGEGFVDFEAVSRTFVDIGYRGWLVLESFTAGDRLADTARNLAFARQLFDGLTHDPRH